MIGIFILLIIVQVLAELFFPQHYIGHWPCPRRLYNYMKWGGDDVVIPPRVSQSDNLISVGDRDTLSQGNVSY